MKICILGTGYVGLVAGTCFADSGNDVTCVDVDAAKIDLLRRGELPIYEPGLEELVLRTARDGRLSFATEAAEAIGAAEVVFIAVGTPPGESGDADVHHVLDAARQIGAAIRHRQRLRALQSWESPGPAPNRPCVACRFSPNPCRALQIPAPRSFEP